MKLKTLEIFGFKSFAERTRIDFTEGVTAIVGPNGCGKSNVVDAVKWVLGEQSVKSLRGREMTDVIFNGSEKRTAMNLAEVTLTFENEDGALNFDGAEVAVSRRLYRSGESEYLINKKTCRLKDVRELFMGTGLGPGGYSFMEQGKIDSILASNPVERRKVFEEAAGISRFRARRHETELKLDKVDANLLRLADIIDELERRERSLKIQAGKAQRYREYQDRASELQAQVALHRFAVNRRDETRLGAALEEARGQRDEVQTERDERRAEVDAIAKTLAEKNEDFSRAREKSADLAARESAAREMSVFHRRRLDELESRSTTRKSEIEELESEIARRVEERERAVHEHGELEGSVASTRQIVSESSASLETLRARATEIDGALRESDASLREFSSQRSALERDGARVETEESRWRDEITRARDEAEKAATEGERLASECDDLKGRLALAEDESRRKNEELGALETQIETLEAQLTEGDAERSGLGAERSHIEGRAQALEALVKRREGLGEGVKALLEAREADPSFLSGCRGVLVDFLRVRRDRAEAIEVALGEAAQALVVDRLDDAFSGARWLETEDRGRAAFLPLDRVKNDASARLPDGVEVTDPSILPLVLRLLDGVHLAAIDDRSELASLADDAAVIVSTRGDLVRDGRLFVLGASNEGSGLLATRSELEELARQRSGLDERIQTLDAQLDRHRGDRDGARDKAREERERASILDARQRSLANDLRDADRQRERATEVGTSATQRVTAAEAKLAEGEEARRELRARLSGLEAEIAKLDGERRDRDEGRSEILNQVEAAARELESRRVELAGTEQRLQTIVNTRRHLEESQERAARIIERFKEELETFAGDREVSGQAATDAEGKVEELARELESGRAGVEEAEKEVVSVRERHDEASRGIRELEKSLETLSESCHRLDMQLTEVRVSQEKLVEFVREELEIDLDALHAKSEEEGEGAEDSAVESDGDREDAPEVDWPAIEAELEDLRDKLRRLGNVNLAAIEDLDEVQERLEFLVAQRDDLIGSKNQLGKILANIEEESTRLFRETFDSVKDEFQVTFRKLFGGGKAGISLADPDNVLESGIDITARPPGKEARSIELMSGGERTLTAVALLFSIIRSHPCPCCLLDEVDAALDEDNTERFGMLLDEFLDQTQFILITHSRRTMARADVLFGVTMGERGVSRPVGVRFEDVDDDGSIKSGAGRELPAPPADESSPEGNGNGQGHSDPKALAQGEVIVEMSEAASEEVEEGGTLAPQTPLRERETEA